MSRSGKKAGRVTAETARRITGISIPFGGLQWADPGPSERERVRHFLLGLEDRRALYNPMYLEGRGDVEYSLHKLREECTEALRSLDEGAFAVVAVRAIREACRRFHDDAYIGFEHYHGHRGSDEDAGFFTALGALRATVGYHVAQLSANYDINIEGELAAVLPKLPEEQ